MRFLTRRARLAAFSTLLLLGAVALAGCDRNDNDRRREPLPPPTEQAQVRDFEVEFDVRDADRAGAIRSAAFDAPELSPAVVEDGLVMAYVREADLFEEDAEVWRALPYTYAFEFEDTDSTEAAVDYTVTLGFSYDVEFFEVSYELSADDRLAWRPLEEQAPQRIRVVTFTGAAVRAAPQSLDFGDYEAVRERFTLDP